MSRLENVIAGGVGVGTTHSIKPVAEAVWCMDGTEISVQGSRMHYCIPRNDAGPYTHVEVGYPGEPPPASWDEYQDGDDPIYAYVPVELVREYVDIHGGELSTECEPVRTVPVPSEDPENFDVNQYARARRHLQNRLANERAAYGLIPAVKRIKGQHVRYNGKGDRFEFTVTFDDSEMIRDYEVTVYGPGRSYRVWEI